MTTPRSAVPKENCWNLSSFYSSDNAWEKAFSEAFPKEADPRWPELAEFRGRLAEGAQTVKKALTTLFSHQRSIDRLLTYAHLRHDEEITENAAKTRYQKMQGIAHAFAEQSSWFEPELLSLPKETLDALLADDRLKEFRFHLEKIARMKPHTLSTEKEHLMALSAKALQAPTRAFCAMNDADFSFGTAADTMGKEKPLTHATYALYLRDKDRTLRENAFKRYHAQFENYENTLAELLQGKTQAHLFEAKARGYNSCVEAALFPHQIPVNVYRALIAAVNENLDALHDYISLRKELLGLEEMRLYDLYVPITPQFDLSMSYEQAEECVIASIAPLGETYQGILRKGFQNEGWVDRFENKNKRSGGYSSGCYDSAPYILMNYKNIIRDVFTLAHEAGHSMHSYLTRSNQPYHYGNYSIFLAEVASTFNEDLLTKFLLKRAGSKQEKIFLLNQKVEDIRTTLFRQTLFAEFELFIHECTERNIPLTPQLLKEEYLKLNRKYFGKNIVVDEEIAIEWARIPHFYYNFYVYQYATGISAALALSDRVTQGGTPEREAYLDFLKAGSSRAPIELLQSAGVDMASALPVREAIKKFRGLVADLRAETTDLAINRCNC